MLKSIDEIPLRKTHAYTRRVALNGQRAAARTQHVVGSRPENRKLPHPVASGIDLYIQFERVKASPAAAYPRRVVVNYFAYCQEHVPEASARERAYALTQLSQHAIARHYFGLCTDETLGLIDAVVYDRLAQRFAQAELFVEHVSDRLKPTRVTVGGNGTSEKTIASLFRLRGVPVHGADLSRPGFREYLTTAAFCVSRSVYDLAFKPIVLRVYRAARIRQAPRDILAKAKFIFWSFAGSHYAAIQPIAEELGKRKTAAILGPSIGRQLAPPGLAEHDEADVPFIPSDALLTFTQCLSLFAKRCVMLSRLLTGKYIRDIQTVEDLFRHTVLHSSASWKVCIPAVWSAETYKTLLASFENVRNSTWIFGDDASPHARGILTVLKASRAASYVVQHGAISDKYLYIPTADKALLWDAISKRMLLPYVRDTKRLAVLGAPKLELFAARSTQRVDNGKARVQSGHLNVLLALASNVAQNESTTAAIVNILAATRDLEGIHIAFRPHPLQDLRPLVEVVEEQDMSLPLDTSDGIEEALSHSDIVVVQSSTVAVEAMLFRKPVIFWSPVEGDWLNTSPLSLSTVVSTGEEFKSVLLHLKEVTFVEKVLTSQDRFLKNIFTVSLKGSTKRIVDVLVAGS